MPSGIVRVISEIGDLFEGYWTEDGHINGWNSQYQNKMITLGWFKNSVPHGNIIRVTEWGAPFAEGYFLDG